MVEQYNGGMVEDQNGQKDGDGGRGGCETADEERVRGGRVGSWWQYTHCVYSRGALCTLYCVFGRHRLDMKYRVRMVYSSLCTAW